MGRCCCCRAASRTIGDLFTAWPVIAASIGIAVVVAFIYCWFVEKCAGFLVWLGIAAALFAGIVLSYSLLRAAQDYKNDPAFNNRYKAVLGLGIISSVLTFAFFIAVVALRDRIR